MKIYYALITDYAGTPVLRLPYTATAKHSAFIAKEYLDKCPPAGGFKITFEFIKPTAIASLLNQGA